MRTAVNNRAGGRGELEGEAHAPIASDDEVFAHAQAHDVAAEVRILDRGEHRET
jgi:hypothetical protein